MVRKLLVFPSIRQRLWLVASLVVLFLYWIRPEDVADVVVEQPPTSLDDLDKSGIFAKLSQDQPSVMPTWRKNFAIVHLGKCGGLGMRETLVGYLGMSTRIGQIVMRSKTYHLSKPEVDEYDEWIVLVRDPISRMRSWWTYDHTDNFLYRKDYIGFPFKSENWPRLFKCYPTLDDFATKGLAPMTSPPDECQSLAQMTVPLRGSSFLTGIQHMRFNFERYYTELLDAQDKHLYVIRAEHMLNDILSINVELGDTPSPTLTGVVHQSHWRTEEYPNRDRYLSPAGLENLCRQLCYEIQIYKQILERGINLRNETRAVSLNHLSKSCPRQTVNTDCPLGMSESEWQVMVEHFRGIQYEDTQQLGRDLEAWKHKVQNPPPPIKKLEKLKLQYSPDHQEDSYGFLHLGRCGGQSVRSLLESHKETHLYQKYVNGTWTSAKKPLLWKHKHWVVIARDPMERLSSWWTYHHPTNLSLRPDRQEQENKAPHLRAELKKFYECYPTLQDLASEGIGKPTQAVTKAKRVCRPIANRALYPTGVVSVPSLDDLSFSYATYERDFTVVDKDKYFIFVVRTEFMATDLNSIEAILTRRPSSVFSTQEAERFKEQSSSALWPVTANVHQLDGMAKTNLCRQMCENIRMYKFFLKEAVNLRKDSYEMSMKKLSEICPVQVKNNGCRKGQ